MLNAIFYFNINKLILLILLSFFITSCSKPSFNKHYISLENEYISEKTNNCGPTALSAVLGYYNIYIHPDVIFKQIYNYKKGGVSSFDMMTYALEKGVDANLYLSSLNDLKNNIYSDIPLILALKTKRETMHFVVIYGINEDGCYLAFDSGNYGVLFTEEMLKERWIASGAIALKIKR